MLFIWALTVTFTLKIQNKSFRMTLQLMLMQRMPILVPEGSHVHKISCEQTFFHILNLCYDLQWRKPIFSINTMACTTIIPRLIEKQSAFQKIFWKQLCFDKWTLTVTVTVKITKHCSAWHSGLYYGVSSYQSPVLQKISSWQTFSDIMNQHYDHNNPKRL